MAPAASAQDTIDRVQLEASIDKGLSWLKGLQQPDGSFKLPPVKTDTLETSFKMGYSSLATLTLLKCGTPPNDPAQGHTASDGGPAWGQAGSDRIGEACAAIGRRASIGPPKGGWAQAEFAKKWRIFDRRGPHRV